MIEARTPRRSRLSAPRFASSAWTARTPCATGTPSASSSSWPPIWHAASAGCPPVRALHNGAPWPLAVGPVIRRRTASASSPTLNGPGKLLDIEPTEATFVREAASPVLVGDNLAATLRLANGPDGSARRGASRWTRAGLGQILTGSAVAGRVVRIPLDDQGHALAAVPVLDADGSPITIPGILSADESVAFRTALAVRTPDARKGGRGPSRLLSSILTCHACGDACKSLAGPADRSPTDPRPPESWARAPGRSP